MRGLRRRLCWAMFVSLGLGMWDSRNFADDSAKAAAPAKGGRADVSGGREIFLREWLPNDPRSHGGDGLGPVFNDTSCVACHNQGGEGGGGSEAKNVMLISAVRNHSVEQMRELIKAKTARTKDGDATQDEEKSATPKKPKDSERAALLAALKELHPGLATSRSVVLHRSATDGEYSAWRQQLLFGRRSVPNGDAVRGPLGGFGVVLGAVLSADSAIPRDMQIEKFLAEPGTFRSGFVQRADGNNPAKFTAQISQRNTTALFGIGLLDSIPDEVLIAAAQKWHSDSPLVSGRVARLKDGRIGKFGWKSQKANLYDFTVTACAVELGLHVPDHVQAGVPHRPEYQPTGFDLTKAECQELVSYLKSLPAPARAPAEHEELRATFQEGEQLFAKVGCAACHVPKLGEVAAIYGDLLLHDMGSESGDAGSYDSFRPGPGSDVDDPLPEIVENPSETIDRHGLQKVPPQMVGALTQEWRTPPLWGVRDSAPYLHDGRAQTLEQAIAMHGGEGQPSAVRFYRLKSEERQKVLAFLRSLVAPSVVVTAKANDRT